MHGAMRILPAIVIVALGLAGCSPRGGERGVPEEVLRQNVLGTAYLGQQKWTEAEQAFRRALELRPEDPLLENNVAVALIQQSRLDEAEALLRQAVTVDPGHPWARYNLGTLLKNRGEFEAAASEFEAVERFDPQDLMTHYNLGMVYARIGREDEAEARYRRALELDPTHVSSLYALGRLLLQRGDEPRGVELINRSQEIRARSGLDEAVGSQYGEQGPYAMGADYPGDVLAAPPPLPVEFEPRAAVALGAPAAARAIVPLAAASWPPGAPPAIFAAGADGTLVRLDATGPGTVVLGPPQAFVVAVAAGALRRDAAVDLVVLSAGERELRALVLPEGDPARADASAAPSITVAARPDAADLTLVDRDHDGDLDLYFCWSAGTAAACALGTNDGSGAFDLRASTEHGFEVAPAGSGAVQVGFSDVDNDRDVDLLLARGGRVDVFANQRDGTFQEISERSGLGGAVGGATGSMAVADLDKNGWMDLVLGTAEGPRIFANRLGRFEPGRTFERAGGGTDRPVVIDHDNDGFLDLARTTRDGLQIDRNLGAGEWSVARVVVADPRGAPLVPLAAVDADLDGDLDLVAARAGQEPALVVLSNAGGNGYRWIRIVSRGAGDNPLGVGAKVEILAGGLRQKHELTGPLPLHQGLGSRESVESVRHLWPSGILQDEIGLSAGATVEVAQLDRKGTSCPLLYARDARGGWRFVTDFLGGAAVGYRSAPGVFNVPDTDEYVKIEGGIEPDGDGALRLRVNNQLQEVIWFDRLELVVVDHPAGTEVYPAERLLPGPPWSPFELYASSDIRPVARASGVPGGEDRTAALAERDRHYVRDLDLLAFKGYAAPHELELDLGPLPPQERVVLLLDGWIDYADSSANVAAFQAGKRLDPPRLSVPDGSGGWRDSGVRMGFPAGLPKTMTVDLTGRLAPADPRVRIATNMRIYWDRARVLVGGRDVPLGVTRLAARSAELRAGGFPEPVSPDGRPPFEYDASRVSWRSPWSAHAGRYTAFGEVADLLRAVDDRFVTTRSGDEIELVFPAPPAPAGSSARTWLLYADGFGKDMDPNSGANATVAPVPFHGMPRYPYGEHVAPPLREADDDRRTRVVLAWPPGSPGAVPQPLAAADVSR